MIITHKKENQIKISEVGDITVFMSHNVKQDILRTEILCRVFIFRLFLIYVIPIANTIGYCYAHRHTSIGISIQT